MANTEKMNLNKTENMAGGSDSSKNATPLLSAPIVLESDGAAYEISTNLIAIGGESQIYHAQEKSTGRMCVAKIDTSGLIYNAGDRENRRQVIEFLRTHTDYKKYHIIPLLASGTLQIQESDGIALPYLVDIFPYCPEGDLEHSSKKFTFAELKDKVIPALSTAIHTIHSSDLIHRDIKPANICELDGEIVLSDFGTTVIIENDEDAVAKTSLARRTLGYSAPEINSRYAKKASDYFSLGCTLATLYNGKHPYASVLAQESDYAFYELITEQGLQMTYQDGDKPLGMLIDALVRIKPSDRVGYDGIMLWLKDSDAFYQQHVASYRETTGSGAGKWKESFSFEDVEYWNEQDLAEAMASNWQEAKRYLYRGQVISFFKWDQTLQNRIDRIVNEPPTAKNDDLGLACFLHYLFKGGSLYWCGQTYKQLPDISAHIWGRVSGGEPVDADLIKMLQSEYLSWKFDADARMPGVTAERKAALEKDLDGIRDIEQIAKSHPYLAYYYAMYQWNKKIKPEIQSADALFTHISRNPANFYSSVEQLMNDDYTWAALAHLGAKGHVLKLKEQMSNNISDNIKNIYTLFENICNDKTAVRSHYYQYGPDSYLYWLKNNLFLYTFNTSAAKNLKSRIERVPFSDSMSLNDLNNSFHELDGYFAAKGDFQVLFQDDFLLACLGLTKGKDRKGQITATHADAFFIDTFYGKGVPAGFRKYLNLSDDVRPDDTAKQTDGTPAEAQPKVPAKQTAAPHRADGVSGTYYDVILLTCGREKIRTIKAVREITNYGLREAKDLVDNAPQEVARGVSDELANVIKTKLESIGIEVKLTGNRKWDKQGEQEIRHRLNQYWGERSDL